MQLERSRPPDPGHPRVVVGLEEGAGPFVQGRHAPPASSASASIVRSFKRVNTSPVRPTRRCRKSTGPPCRLTLDGDEQHGGDGSRGERTPAHDVEHPLEDELDPREPHRLDVDERLVPQDLHPESAPVDAVDAARDLHVHATEVELADRLVRAMPSASRASTTPLSPLDTTSMRSSIEPSHGTLGPGSGSASRRTRGREHRAPGSRRRARPTSRRLGSPATTTDLA